MTITRTFSLFAALALLLTPSVINADIIAAPGVLNLGSDGDTATSNNNLLGTAIYGLNSMSLLNSGGSSGIIELTSTGTAGSNAVGLGRANANNSTTGGNIAFAAEAGQLLSFTFDFLPSVGITGTPTFQVRYNAGASADRVNVSPTTTDLGGGVTRYSVTDFVITDATSTTESLALFISFSTGNGFPNGGTDLGDITGASININSAAVPEPSSIASLSALLGIMGLRRRRTSAA